MEKLIYLRMEEDFGSQESLISDVYRESLVVDRIASIILLNPLALVTIILVELLCNVWTDIAELFCEG